MRFKKKLAKISIFLMIFFLNSKISSAIQMESDKLKSNESGTFNGMLVLDEDLLLNHPKQYRSSLRSSENSAIAPVLQVGLPELHFISSAQFSERTLTAALKTIPGKVWLVDLRRETHGFINGIPISWYMEKNRSNLGLTNPEILKKEEEMLHNLISESPVVIYQIQEKTEGIIGKTKTITVQPKLIESEAQLAKRLNVGYLRIGVSDHHRPADKDVDEFIQFVNTLPAKDWLYFHCRGGKGRSSTFVIMYDILRNGRKLSLQQISDRQVMLGSKNLLKIKHSPDVLWKKEAAEKRKDFIAQFYEYGTSRDGYPKNAWSQWLILQK